MNRNEMFSCLFQGNARKSETLRAGTELPLPNYAPPDGQKKFTARDDRRNASAYMFCLTCGHMIPSVHFLPTGFVQ